MRNMWNEAKLITFGGLVGLTTWAWVCGVAVGVTLGVNL